MEMRPRAPGQPARRRETRGPPAALSVPKRGAGTQEMLDRGKEGASALEKRKPQTSTLSPVERLGATNHSERSEERSARKRMSDKHSELQEDAKTAE